jgi:ribosomal protein S18 acetylase RimI-like enzyme
MSAEPAPPHPASLLIQPLSSERQARSCAGMMASSDPWRRLGRSFEESLSLLRDPSREAYVALEPSADTEPRVAGFTILIMQGAFVGYIQSVAVREDCRSRGVGTALVEFAERRILRETPNVFICVSSFNAAARRLYERLGYKVVGELTDYIVRGHSEILMRKTIGPLTEFRVQMTGSGPGI